MEQNEALVRQEAMPENNPNARRTFLPNRDPDMETLLQEEGLTLDFPKPGEIRTGVDSQPRTERDSCQHWYQI
jgi:hypothetical protein